MHRTIQRRLSSRLDEAAEPRAGERLRDVAKQDDGPELSAVFYRGLAERLRQDYGRGLDIGWESIAARRYVSSTRATSGIVIDEKKLRKALIALRDEAEDAVLDEAFDPVHSAASYLRSRSVAETPVLRIIDESNDAVGELERSKVSGGALIERANSVFRIREMTAPAALRKQVGSTELRVPATGRIPTGRAPRALDERVLDAFVRAWNSRSRAQGNMVAIEWNPSQHDPAGVCFSAVLC